LSAVATTFTATSSDRQRTASGFLLLRILLPQKLDVCDVGQLVPALTCGMSSTRAQMLSVFSAVRRAWIGDRYRPTAESGSGSAAMLLRRVVTPPMTRLCALSVSSEMRPAGPSLNSVDLDAELAASA